jgi:hypothetical protein
MDVGRSARFLRPGHRVTGDRSQRSCNWRPETGSAATFAHAIVDDYARLAYVDLHEDEKAATVPGFGSSIDFLVESIEFAPRPGLRSLLRNLESDRYPQALAHGGEAYLRLL